MFTPFRLGELKLEEQGRRPITTFLGAVVKNQVDKIEQRTQQVDRLLRRPSPPG
ncbi:MAG TPA: hypothetical protein VFU43_02970 [Streptosporangiaceae bacterium]|nr:hypothetical protein [Streptosporangiaceae bacterium]